MRVRASAIVERNGHLLLLKYRYGGKDVYNLPGGNPAEGESLPDAVVREWQEEMDLKVKVTKLLLVAHGVAHRPSSLDSVLHMVYHADLLAGEATLNPQETTAQAACWVSWSEVADLALYPAIQPILAQGLPHLMAEAPQDIDKFEQPWY